MIRLPVLISSTIGQPIRPASPSPSSLTGSSSLPQFPLLCFDCQANNLVWLMQKHTLINFVFCSYCTFYVISSGSYPVASKKNQNSIWSKTGLFGHLHVWKKDAPRADPSEMRYRRDLLKLGRLGVGKVWNMDCLSRAPSLWVYANGLKAAA